MTDDIIFNFLRKIYIWSFKDWRGGIEADTVLRSLLLIYIAICGSSRN